LISQTEK